MIGSGSQEAGYSRGFQDVTWINYPKYLRVEIKTGFNSTDFKLP